MNQDIVRPFLTRNRVSLSQNLTHKEKSTGPKWKIQSLAKLCPPAQSAEAHLNSMKYFRRTRRRRCVLHANMFNGLLI